jgi:hypothetical protein
VNTFRYIRRAFSNRWNILGLLGGIGFSLLSGRPEVGLSLVAAAELAWLGFVGTHPAFRRHVDMLDHAATKAEQSTAADDRMQRILKSLSRSSQKRFNRLMIQCRELRSISKEINIAHGNESTDDLRQEIDMDGLDHLLWLYLKLLYTEHSLNRFFETTTIEQIDRELTRVKARLKREADRTQSGQRDRIIATLQDNLSTSESRKANFQQARDSYDLVKAEQQRLEARIRSIAEMGISRGDPNLLSSQVDSVTGSIAETEKTLNDLNFVTGFTAQDEAVPEILPRPMQVSS